MGRPSCRLPFSIARSSGVELESVRFVTFVFERYDVYRVAKRALEIVIGNRKRIAGLPGKVADQLHRATVSMMAAIGEAFGRQGSKDRRFRFALARSEANEAGVLVEIVRMHGVLAASVADELSACLRRVTYMTTALMR